MTSRRIGDIISGSAVALLGLYGLLTGIPDQVQMLGGGGGVSPRVYPQLLAALLVIFGGGVVLGAIRSSDTAQDAETQTEGAQGLVRVGLTVLVCGIVLILSPVIGLLVAAVPALAIIAFIIGLRKPVPIILLAVLVPVCLHLLAVELLGMRMPGPF